MNKILKYIIVSIIIVSYTGCTDDFENINTDPNSIPERSLEQMNNDIGAPFTPMFLNVINITPAWNYQLQQGVIGDVYSGYMTPPTPFAGNINNMTYSLIDGWNEFPWNNAYNNVMPFALKIKTIVNERSNPPTEFIHLANIIKVSAMHRVTDIYGPIRYTKFDDFATTGEYDSQELVYNTFFNDLKIAIDGLKDLETSQLFAPFDLSAFGGDITKWRKYANSLRLRLAMRVVKVDPTLAKTQGELALASDAGFLESNSDDMKIDGGFPNPILEISSSWGDIRMSAEMESILEGYNDGRKERYFKPATDEDLAGAYKGIRMGIDITAKTQYGEYSGVGKVVEKGTVQWMSASEVWFLRAEAALRGWAGAGDAKTHYETGIKTSFSQHNVDGSATYLADNTSTPKDFVDVLNPANNIAYPSDVKIAYNNAGTNEEQLEQIITQKWIAMFPEGQEAWSEFRRTGYPRIFPVVINNSGGKIDTDIQIRRIDFILGERNTNTANVEQARTLLGGPDNGGTRLWWDIAGGNF
ncbi:RagB/SusD family nutrient uptake outer membrane protein [Aquimarina muelleri]|uniref:SusD/RagB family nutrient-binding outer membrane lipoprotein n=1 Tax=Aquimarina muelleri TaxID=279356 RepID=A0A918JW54_9FLAO|nr:RagB/SusD family nutrient uptake outer membrane protein [Aquimarina muelleri]MCX2762236.1 SusD/RagB family nutrient-binding outer membrane lipoprotein [Aquimarina muelleri]GGX18178.1 hypothetical protein GCM10007384_19580 [Aquimarina muelleri]